MDVFFALQALQGELAAHGTSSAETRTAIVIARAAFDASSDAAATSVADAQRAATSAREFDAQAQIERAAVASLRARLQSTADAAHTAAANDGAAIDARLATLSSMTKSLTNLTAAGVTAAADVSVARATVDELTALLATQKIATTSADTEATAAALRASNELTQLDEVRASVSALVDAARDACTEYRTLAAQVTSAEAALVETRRERVAASARLCAARAAGRARGRHGEVPP